MNFRALLFVAAGTIAMVALFILPIMPAEAGLVPCGLREDDLTTLDIVEFVPCRPCHLFILGHRVFNFLVLQVALPLFILVVIIAGVVMMFSGGFGPIPLPGGGSSPGLRGKARGILEAALIGLVIVLLSWALINTIIVWLVGQQTAQKGFPWPWDKPACPQTQQEQCFIQCYKNCLSDVTTGIRTSTQCSNICQAKCF